MGLGIRSFSSHRTSEETYEIFKASLDQALQELAESNGERHRAVEKAYNEHWPDGLTVCITRDGNGGFAAVFSSGETLRFEDADDMGAALLVLRDRALFRELEKRTRLMQSSAAVLSPQRHKR